MLRLLLCEKPSVAQNIAYSLGANERISDGKVSYYQGNGYIVTNAVGHIVGIGMPEDYGWDKWELSSLPMMPDFRLFPLYGYGEQLRLLKKLLFRDDVSEVINACDAGREGEAIFRYIYDYLGCKKPVKRLWISSMTDESIRQGMNTLRDGADMEKLFAAAFTRAKADWIHGMSLSRLYSIVNDDSHKVGRVKTPVLNIIAERDKAIAGFVSKPFFKVLLPNGAECETICDTKAQAEELAAECSGKTVTVTSAETKQKKEERPLLHSLTSLQQEANEVYGMTAAATLKAAQSLYEQKFITYPRTDSNYLTDDMKPLVGSIVKCLSGYDERRVQQLESQGLNLDGRVFNNSKVSDHHALIPTNIIGRLGQAELTDAEKNVAKLVIERFLGVLDQPYLYNETKYVFDADGVIFRLTVKTPVQLGWRTYKKEPQETPAVSYRQGDSFPIGEVTIKEGETTPPKHFTESSLLAVMENIDRLIENKELKTYVKERGLGTPATRASIIEELISAGYIERSKKMLLSTDYGRAFAASLPENVKSAELTAHWEQMLSDIEHGEAKPDDLLREIGNTVSDIVQAERQRTSRIPVTRKVTVGICPRCGRKVCQNRKGFSCEASKEKCGFFIFGHDKRIGRDYTAAEIKELLGTGKVTLRNCTSSKGKKYSAVFALENTGQYVNLRLIEFVNDKKRRTAD